MNVGNISTLPCVDVLPPPDTRCDDPAFALANPANCPTAPRFIIKPGVALICTLHGVNFRAFLIQDGAEIDVTQFSIFASSNTGVAMIGATTGSATGTGAGAATISATYNGLLAQADLTVIAGDSCCDDVTVAMMALVDQSRSMTQNFSSSYTSKLVYAKAAAKELIGSVNSTKDLVGLARFSALETSILSVPVSDKDAVKALVPQILQTQEDTTFYDAITACVATLNLVTADQKIIVLISDGEDTTSSYVQFPNPIEAAENFRAAGGIFVCLGVRAHGAGYSLLSALATGGFFLNAFEATQDSAIDYLTALKGYICAGSCGQAGDTTESQGALGYTGLTNWWLVNQYDILVNEWEDQTQDADGAYVDLHGNGFFDYLPGNGLYPELMADASTTTRNPHLVTKSAFAIAAGKDYRVTLDLAGNQVQADPTAAVFVKVLNAADGSVVVSSIIAIPDYLQGFHTYTVAFSSLLDVNVKLVIYQYASGCLSGTGACPGILLGSVALDDLTDGTTLFSDDFNSENLVYVPPKCGSGTTLTNLGLSSSTITLWGAGTSDVDGDYTKNGDTEWDQVGGAGYTIILNAGTWEIQDGMANVLYTCSEGDFPNGPWSVVTGAVDAPTGAYATLYGYAYGYNCYGEGCLENPPPPQLQDPNPLPALESGYTSPGDFTSTKNVCASCDVGYVNIGQALDATTLGTGQEYQTIISLTGAATAIACWRVTMNRLWNSSGIVPYHTLLLQGSNDNSTWTDLDSHTNIFALAGLTLTYALSPATAAYKYFRASLGAGFPSASGKVMDLEVFGVAPALVCKDGSGTGSTQGEADTAATKAALDAAKAALNCVFVYTATAIYTAQCEPPQTGSATRSAVGSSLNSQDEANQIAGDAAKAAAEAALVCQDP